QEPRHHDSRKNRRPSGGMTPGAARSSDALGEVAQMIMRGKEVLDELIADWEGKISAEATTESVLAGLSSAQRQQLAALVCETCDALEIYMGRKRMIARLGKLSKEADRRRHMLVQKAKHAKKSSVALRDYARQLDPVIGAAYVATANRCLQELEPLCRQPTDFSGTRFSESHYRELRSGLLDAPHPVPDDPTQFNMVRLYWFFRHGCAVTGDESEVRTGLIRNAFWKEWIKPVDVRRAYNSGESAGCAAVHIAIHRFRS